MGKLITVYKELTRVNYFNSFCLQIKKKIAENLANLDGGCASTKFTAKQRNDRLRMVISNKQPKVDVAIVNV